jgi:hypothetical protein
MWFIGLKDELWPTGLPRPETRNAQISRDIVAQWCPLMNSALRRKRPIGESVTPSGRGPFKT